MNATRPTTLAICASFAMLFVGAESNAQSGSRNAPSYGSSSRISSAPIQPSVNYTAPRHFAQPSQPLTNVYRPAAPMPQSRYNGYQSTNGCISQPRSYAPHSSCNSTISLRVPYATVQPTPAYRTLSPQVNHLPSTQYFPTSQYIAPVSNGFSPTISRPGCANGNCGR